MLVAVVVVERGIDRPGVSGLSYRVPSDMQDLRVGERVEVPLGKSDSRVQGLVVEVGAPVPMAKGLPVRLKAISRRLGSAFPGSLVELGHWIARYYCCPLGMVLASMVPAAVKKQTGQVTRVLLERVGPGPPGPLDTEVSAGPKLSRLAAAAWDKISRLDSGAFPISAKELAQLIEVPTVGPVNRLVAAGRLREVTRESVRATGWMGQTNPGGEARPRAHRLTTDQEACVGAVVATLGTFSPHLLRGVTGSGKTEVYLSVLERVIGRGESAIVLVPEISLTPQTAGRFLARFGAVGVAVLHSGLTASQRHQQWKRVQDGEARVVVGARSAVFAPLGARGDAGVRSPLGLIVVDEEHDQSYKQDQLPRYHARDVAVRRAQLAGCPVVLGSATPSLESWHNAAILKRFILLELPERVGGGVLPRVEVVDLAEERRARTGPDARLLHGIGPRLEHAVGQTLDTGGQVILLLNRRGYANYICCPDQRCGWVMTCSYCDVTMVFHRGGGQTGKRDSVGSRGALPALCRCHHCLAEQALPTVCPVCSKQINTFGFGTQRLEEELARKFPELVEGRTMLRLDADTMSRAADYFEALDRFASGEIRVLLGTQMIAKGLDFPNVRLVGVINADTALNLPDFRSTERTFQLVSQVAGRAGRGDHGGLAARDTVIVQTFNPREAAIEFAAHHDYRGFAERELAMRAATGLPPIGRMARIVCRDEDPAKAQGAAARIAAALREGAGDDGPESGLRVRGPMACPISRIAGHFRVAVEIAAPTAAIIQVGLARVRSMGLVKSDEHTAVDVDPVALL